MSERNVYLSRALGFNQRVSLDAKSLDSPAVSFRTGGMGFGPVATLYGGALLKPGTDGKLWCIDPGSGRSFWSTDLGDRLTGSPVVIGLDVYMATDAARLYTLDIASGALLGETELSGPVYGSVATDGKNLFMISSDGRLHGIEAGGRTMWSVEVAPYTDSTPAVDGGTVYMADQKGTARAVRVADGKTLWSHELGSEFGRCPVVLPDRVVFGCSDGRLTALRRSNGEQLWQTQLKTRFLRYDPVPLLLDIPGRPAVPERPAIPAKPAVPAQPAVPAKKAVKAKPAVPATATSPAVPAVPAQPAVPAKPAVPEQPAVPAMPAVPAQPAVPARQMGVLLCMDDEKPLLIGVADGRPTEQQVVTGSVQKDGNFKPDGKAPGIGELTAPISYYKGYLAFVPIDGDTTAVPMYNDSRYHNMGSGAAFLLKPKADAAGAAAAGPRGIARLSKPVKIDGVVEADEWGKSLFSLDGPEDIFPTDRRAQGPSDGATTWSGYDDLGARVYLGWDDEALYMAVKVEDDRHFNAQPPDMIWNGDAIQMGLAAGKTHWNLALALTEGGVVFRQVEGAKDKDMEETAGFSVKREGNQTQTFYEMRLPLADLGLKPGDEFNLNVCVLDDDKGDGQRYWLQTSPGLLGLGPRDPPPGCADGGSGVRC
jgi:hypothetical protein